MSKEKIKYLSAILVAGSLLSFVPAPALADYDQAKAISYLKSSPLDEWSVMTLASANSLTDVNLDFLKSDPGNKPTDIEKRILAIVAAGQNPETFGQVNLIQKLISNFNGTEISSSLAPNLLNDDIFGLLALAATNKNLENRAVLASFIKQNQNTDGGWSYTYKGSSSDSNDTAMAVMALLANGENFSSAPINNAFNYLATTKTSNGYSFDAVSGYGADSASTSWAISALNAAGRTIPSAAEGYLKSLQLPDGSFAWQAGGTGSTVMTAYAVIALNNDFYPVRSGGSNPSFPQFQVLLKGPSSTIFQGTVSYNQFSLTDSSGQTHNFTQSMAIGTVSESARVANFSYTIRNTSFGLFVDCIAQICSQGTSGWMYALNGVKPNIGSAEYILQNNDKVIWFFGAPSDPVPTWPGSTNTSAALNLSANIVAPPTPPPVIIFGIDTASTNFGDLRAGQTSDAKAVRLTNSGSINLEISTTMSNSDALFREGLFLDNSLWTNYRTSLDANFAKSVNLLLKVPANYQGRGSKTGTLIFWATPR
ncbi:MAG: DUF4430 domain-containing protein [bacterium]|nr:DUF4430 domain-containing protein [bacterium]